MYSGYFLFRSNLKLNDKNQSQLLGEHYLDKYPDHFLSDSVLFLLAENFFENKNFDTAYNYLLANIFVWYNNEGRRDLMTDSGFRSANILKMTQLNNTERKLKLSISKLADCYGFYRLI